MQTHKFYFKRLIITTISLHLLFFKCGMSTLRFIDCICQLPEGCQLCYAIKGTALRGLSVKSVGREISRIFIPTLSNTKIKKIYMTTPNTEASYFILQGKWFGLSIELVKVNQKQPEIFTCKAVPPVLFLTTAFLLHERRCYPDFHCTLDHSPASVSSFLHSLRVAGWFFFFPHSLWVSLSTARHFGEHSFLQYYVPALL